MTSHDCVAQARRCVGMRRIGHAGTLDPAVCGVLPLLLGRATRIADFMHEVPKVYEASMCLGVATDTEDGTGQPIQAVDAVHVSEDDVVRVVRGCVGTMTVQTPLYAAARVQGKRLYEWARIQPTIVRPMRTMTVHAIDVIDIDVQRPHPTVRFRVTCAKGTYVRTLCVDIGARLGYPAHMRTLSRVECGGIVAQQCVGLDDVRRACAQGTLDARLWSIDRALSFLPSVHVDAAIALRIAQGQMPLAPTDVPHGEAVRIVHALETIAVCAHMDGHLRMRCVLTTPEAVRTREGSAR